MRRRSPLLLLLAGAVLALAACGARAGGPSAGESATSWAPQPAKAGRLSSVADVAGERLLLHTSGGERDFVPGVNIGSTVPGFSPGELNLAPETVRQWFTQIGDLKIRALRVYTIMPPSFYAELAAYNNAHREAPLYLIQGVWIPEEAFVATKNLFAPAVREGFRREIVNASAALHGDFSRSRRRGVSWGTWTADVSPWLMAYSIGVEWDPRATVASDAKNRGRRPYRGRYFTARATASPTEIWLAEMLDVTAAAEARRGVCVPLTFTNWPTTDPLKHPDEPLATEELVGVDANQITVNRKTWPAGYFASYHAYPYYPDFQRYEKRLFTLGKGDPYAGYLAALRAHHKGLPVVITEFGVPSATAFAHAGPLGRDQGNHSEQEAMKIDADLLRIIRAQGCSGGFVFAWMDEWFKFTWNTIDYELPTDRRQMWPNPWTNEEHFGLLAMDPGSKAAAIVDGKGKDWTREQSQVIFEGRGPVREVRATHDEGYLYLRVVLDDANSWKKSGVTLGFDVIAGNSGGLPAASDMKATREYPQADYAVVVGPGERARNYVRASNDQYVILYGAGKRFFSFDAAALREGSRVWDLQTLITNRPQTIPSTGERKPVEFIAVGETHGGSSDPAAKNFDSRSEWAADEVLELRLPWEEIGLSDPSSRQALRVGRDGALTTTEVERIGIALLANGTTSVINGYAWEPWQKVTWRPRLKAGVELFARAVADVQEER